ncbi:MAG TPA: hypothetical protein VFL56_00355 [Solirubrobacterales bacterium]|nr:hypothetical protein [Solirubrobacterales bacterium]
MLSPRLKRQGFTVAIAAAALSIAPAAEAGSSTVATHDLAGSPAEIRDYWTPERMRAAEPLDDPGGGRLKPGLATEAAAAPDQELPPELDATYPYRIHGKLFLTLNGANGQCSGTVVTSFSRNLVLTAGHCVAEPRGGGQTAWASNLLFVPAYRDGNRPLGSFPGTNLGAPAGWAAAGAISFDVGIVKLAPGRGGAIQDGLGSRGLAFNRAAKSFRRKTFQMFGYPAGPEPTYDGERPILCSSPFLGLEVFSASLVAGPCHQQQGASGGGWVEDGGLVTSLTSHSACANARPSCTAIAGTYLGRAAFKLWSAIGGGLPKGLKKKIKGCKRKRSRKKRQRCQSRYMTFQPVIR